MSSVIGCSTVVVLALGEARMERWCSSGHEKRGAACAVPLGLPWLRSLVVLCPAGLGPGPALLVMRGPDLVAGSGELVGVLDAQRASRRLTPV